MDSENTEIDHGERVTVFLNDEAVKAAFARLKNQYVAQFAASKAGEEAMAVWSKMRVFDDILMELGVSVQRGAVAKIKKEKRLTKTA